MTPPMFAVSPLTYDLFIALIVLGSIVVGSQVGLFRSTVAALTAVTALFAPLAVADPLARWLVRMDGPPRDSAVIAFLVLLVASAFGLRWLTSRWIRKGSMRLDTLTELLGGSFIGAVAGTATAGAALVIASIVPFPRSLWPDPATMRFDAGGVMLDAFVRSLEHEGQSRAIMLQGEPLAEIRGAGRLPGRPGDAPLPAGTCLASEPFVDANGNRSRDDGERYLDTDGNKIFSPRLIFTDTNANGRRDIGLIERYRLGDWHVVMQADSDGAGERGPAAGQEAAVDTPE